MVLDPKSLLGEVFQVHRCWALLARATKRKENKQEMLLLPSLPVGMMVPMLEGVHHEVPHSVFLGSYLSALLAVTIGNREVGGEGPEKYYLLYQELSACMNEKAKAE